MNIFKVKNKDITAPSNDVVLVSSLLTLNIFSITTLVTLKMLIIQELICANGDILPHKQPFADVLQNRCSQKFGNIHRKTTVLESLFNKVAGLQHRCFYVNIAKFLRTHFFIEHLRWLLLPLSLINLCCQTGILIFDSIKKTIKVSYDKFSNKIVLNFLFWSSWTYYLIQQPLMIQCLHLIRSGTYLVQYLVVCRIFKYF